MNNTSNKQSSSDVMSEIKDPQYWLYIAVLFIFGMMISKVANAQYQYYEPAEHVFKNQRKNILIFSFGYTYVPEGSAIHHETDGLFVPSIGLDYKRRISEKWALSLFTDWELDHYVVWKSEFIRDEAFIAVIGGSYEIGDGFGAFAGVGREFDYNHDLWVTRIGLEYGFELGNRWIIVSSAFFDWKESYDTYSFSIGISHKF